MQAMVDRVHAIAAQEHMPKGLKLDFQPHLDLKDDPAEVDYDSSDSEEEEEGRDEEEEEESNDDSEEDTVDDIDDDIAQVAGEAPGQFAEVI